MNDWPESRIGKPVKLTFLLFHLNFQLLRDLDLQQKQQQKQHQQNLEDLKSNNFQAQER